jgi:hypothetical protein
MGRNRREILLNLAKLGQYLKKILSLRKGVVILLMIGLLLMLD